MLGLLGANPSVSFFSQLFSFFNRDLTGRTWTQRQDHEFFGPMVLFATKKPTGSYWEAELDCEGRLISVAIESPKREEPSEAQVQFAKKITSNIDETFARTSSILVPEFEKWHQLDCPTNWRDALTFVGFSIPEDGDESHTWEVSFESLTDKSGHQLTCYFEKGSPSYVTIDG